MQAVAEASVVAGGGLRWMVLAGLSGAWSHSTTALATTQHSSPVIKSQGHRSISGVSRNGNPVGLSIVPL